MAGIVPEPSSHGWHVVWTRSNYEDLVYHQLAGKGLTVFLPTIESWCRPGGVRQRVTIPLFKGYLFLRTALDKAKYLEVRKVRGVVRILGDRWDRLAVVPESEIAALQTVVSSQLPILPYRYLHDGARVRIAAGPLAGLEGIVVSGEPNKGLIVVSIALLRRSVAVHLDCTMLEAA